MIRFFPHTPRGAELKPYAIVRKGYNHMEEKFGSAFTDKIKIEPFRSKVKEMVEASELNKTGKLDVVDHLIKTAMKEEESCSVSAPRANETCGERDWRRHHCGVGGAREG